MLAAGTPLESRSRGGNMPFIEFSKKNSQKGPSKCGTALKGLCLVWGLTTALGSASPAKAAFPATEAEVPAWIAEKAPDLDVEGKGRMEVYVCTHWARFQTIAREQMPLQHAVEIYDRMMAETWGNSLFIEAMKATMKSKPAELARFFRAVEAAEKEAFESASENLKLIGREKFEFWVAEPTESDLSWNHFMWGSYDKWTDLSEIKCDRERKRDAQKTEYLCSELMANPQIAAAEELGLTTDYPRLKSRIEYAVGSSQWKNWNYKQHDDVHLQIGNTGIDKFPLA